MGERQVSEPTFWSQKQLSTLQVPESCHLGNDGISRLLFSYWNCLTSMQTGQSSHTTSALSTRWRHEPQRTNTIVDLLVGPAFLSHLGSQRIDSSRRSHLRLNWNSGTGFTVVLSKSVQPVAYMAHAVMQRSLCKYFSWMSLLISSTFSHPFPWHSANKNDFLLLGRVSWI